MATAKTETEPTTDPKTQSYIVRERVKATKPGEKDDFSESLVVGLDNFHKKWKFEHLDLDDFYDLIMDYNVQRSKDISVRVATKDDLDKYGDQQKVAELVNRYRFWDDEQERMKNDLRAEIMVWVEANVHTKADLVAFLANNFINTNQLAAIAYGARRKVTLSDAQIDVFAEYVAEKSKGTKYPRTAEAVRDGLYAERKR